MSALVFPPPALLAKTKRAVIFSAPLVPPVLAGTKTVTRRMSRAWLKLPVGTLLFMTENWRLYTWSTCTATIEYVAGGSFLSGRLDCPNDWLDRERRRVEAFIAKQPTNTQNDPRRARPLRPSILLPRWASRCVLRITEPPRLERVGEITETEAKREGVEPGPYCDRRVCDTPHRCSFIHTWHRLHDKPGQRWTDNPEVVRIAFERSA